MLIRLLLLALISVPFFVHAQEEGDGEVEVAEEAPVQVTPDIPVKISKTRKGKAIIHYKSSFRPKPGDIYVLTKKGVNSSMAKGIGSLESGRKHLLGVNLDLGFLDDKTSASSTSRQTISTEIKYGWNNGTTEFGPLFSYQFTRYPATDSKAMLFGGFFDFNFSPNVTEAESVIGARVTAKIGQDDESTQTKAADVMEFTGGLVYKWFGLSTNFCFDFDLSYVNRETKLTSSQTTSGFVGHLGIQTYF